MATASRWQCGWSVACLMSTPSKNSIEARLKTKRHPLLQHERTRIVGAGEMPRAEICIGPEVASDFIFGSEDNNDITAGQPCDKGSSLSLLNFLAQ